MQPQQFVAKWRQVNFGEKQASQEMFLDICALVNHLSPVAHGYPDSFTFEKAAPGGSADAYLEEHFGWEFKSRDNQMDQAMAQLLRYQVHLKPPLLIVSSFQTIRVRTNFRGMESALHEIPVVALAQPEQLEKLRWAFHSPEEFRTNRTVAEATKDSEVFSQRSERGSILVPTNLPFDEWTEVFGSERLTGALLDRLTFSNDPAFGYYLVSAGKPIPKQ